MRRLLIVLAGLAGCADGTTDDDTTALPRGGFADGPPPVFWDAPPVDPAADAGASDAGWADLAEPDPTELDAAVPDGAEADALEADAAEPDAAEPDPLELDMSQPDAVEPNLAEPDSAEPDMAEPDFAEPDFAVAAPDVAAPDVAEPDMAIPDATPDLPPLPDLGPPDPGVVVINEVDYDQPGQDEGEFIELANVGGSPVSLAGWQIELINGANGQIYGTVELDGLLAAGQLFLLAPPAIADQAPPAVQTQAFAGPIQNGAPDGLRLLDAAGVAVDGLAYEGAMAGIGEGSTPEDSDPGEGSLSRCHGEPDSDDNRADFVLRPPTPGAHDPCD